MTKFTLPEGEDFVLTVDDCRKAGHCAQGIRRWFEGMGFDFRDFLRNGKSAREILETGDGLAEQVVSRAWESRRHG